MKKRGRLSIYAPMLKKIRIGEYLSFETQDQATACVHCAKNLKIVVRQEINRTKIRGKVRTSYRVYKRAVKK